MTSVKSGFYETLRGFRAQDGRSFDELSGAAPVLMIFLRHLSCPFCRRMLRDVRDARADIEAQGVVIAFVHMAEEEDARKVFQYYRVEDLPRFTDPQRRLYRLAGLRHMNWRNLVSPMTLRDGWRVRRELNDPKLPGGGNPFQMPGVFLIDQGHVVAGHGMVDLTTQPDLIRFLSAA